VLNALFQAIGIVRSAASACMAAAAISNSLIKDKCVTGKEKQRQMTINRLGMCDANVIKPDFSHAELTAVDLREAQIMYYVDELPVSHDSGLLRSSKYHHKPSRS